METKHPLRAYRDRAGLSLEDLAKKSDTTRATLSRIENGRQNPSMALVSRIVMATNGEMKPNDFFLFRGEVQEAAGIAR